MPFNRLDIAEEIGNKKVVIDIAERLYAASIDEVIPYSALEDIVPEIRGRHRYMAERAKLLLNKRYGIIFKAEHKVGWRRLSSPEGVKVAPERALKRSRNAAKSGYNQTTNALKFANDVSDEEARMANQQLGRLGMIELLARPRSVRSTPTSPTGNGHDDETLRHLKETLGL